MRHFVLAFAIVVSFNSARAQRADDDLRSGLIALSRGDLAAARTALAAAAKTNPNSGPAWIGLAQADLKSGKKDEALAAVRQAERVGANNPAIQHALSMFYAELGNVAKAAAWERKYATTPAADSQAALRAASLSLNASENVEAVKWAEIAVKQNDTPAAHNLLGKAYAANGKIPEAMAELRRAAEADPKSAGLLNDYGTALLQAQDFADAAKVFDEGRMRFPTDPQMELSYGVACYGQRRFKDAVDSFLRVTDIDPKIEQPYIFLGRILDQAGDRLPVVTARLDAWRKTAPNEYLPPFLYAKALMAAESGDTAVIEAELRRSVKLKSDFWESHFELGQLLLKRREWQTAADELSRSVRLNPENAPAHFQLARAYDKLGKHDLAEKERAEHERLAAEEKASDQKRAEAQGVKLRKDPE